MPDLELCYMSANAAIARFKDRSLSPVELMTALNAEHGITFLFSTHDPYVMHAARRLVRLHDGRIVEDDRSEQR